MLTSSFTGIYYAIPLTAFLIFFWRDRLKMLWITARSILTTSGFYVVDFIAFRDRANS